MLRIATRQVWPQAGPGAMARTPARLCDVRQQQLLLQQGAAACPHSTRPIRAAGCPRRNTASAVATKLEAPLRIGSPALYGKRYPPPELRPRYNGMSGTVTA